MQNKCTSCCMRLYYLSCLLLVGYVFIKVVAAAQASTYSLMYAAWLAPMLWQTASQLFNKLGKTTNSVAESVRIPDGCQSGKAISKLMEEACAGDAINGVAVSGIDEQGDLVYDYWHCDWSVYYIANRSDFSNAVWTADVGFGTWCRECCTANSRECGIVKLTHYSQEEYDKYNKDQRSPCLLLEGRSRSHIKAFVAFAVGRYGRDDAPPVRRAQGRTPNQEQHEALAEPLISVA